MSIKVLLADDEEVIRRAIRALLAEHPEIELVGEATGFSEAFQMVDSLGPQVVLLDLHMKDGEDFSPGEINHRLTRNASVIGMSIWNDSETKQFAEGVGAAVFLDKVDLATTLVPTIEKVASPDSHATPD